MLRELQSREPYKNMSKAVKQPPIAGQLRPGAKCGRLGFLMQPAELEEMISIK